MTRILFLYNVHTPFVALDEQILSARYDLKSVYITQRTPRLLSDAWHDTRDIDVIVAWFASWHSLAPFLVGRLRNIPRLLIAGGYDVANMPHIDYGLRRGGMSKWVSGMVFRSANRVLPFSDYAYAETIHNTPTHPDKVRRVHLGVPDVPLFAQPIPKENIAFTVSTIDRVSITRKGLRAFVEAASLLPDVPFIVVGKARDDGMDELKQIATPNVTFTGFLSDDDLNALRHRAKVYVQASQHEGFGLAMAEAMLARCAVVATGVGSLPEVLGDYGLTISDNQPQIIADGIQKALLSDEQLGEDARRHILTQFPLETRAQALYDEVERLIHQNSTTTNPK